MYYIHTIYTILFHITEPLTSLLTKQSVEECFSFIDFSAGFNVYSDILYAYHYK